MSSPPVFIQVTAVVGGVETFVRAESIESIVTSGTGSMILNRGKGALQVAQSPAAILELMNPTPPSAQLTPYEAAAK